MSKNKVLILKAELIVSVLILLVSFGILFITIDKKIDIQLAAVKNSNNKVTVNFDSNGGSKVESKTIIKGGKVDKPKTPTKSGYVFYGWILDEKKYDFSSPVTKNIKLKASWGANKYDCKSIDGSKYQICVDGYILPSRRQLQNFAIMGNYVYFSFSYYGGWSSNRGNEFSTDEGKEILKNVLDNKIPKNLSKKQKNLYEKAKLSLKEMYEPVCDEKGICTKGPKSNSHIMRLGKKNFKKDNLVTEYKWSGHAQSFDIKNENGVHKIFFNNAASPVIAKIGSEWRYGVKSNGIAITSMREFVGTSKSLKLTTRWPGKTIFIDDKNKKVTAKLSINDKKNYVKNKAAYYKSLISKDFANNDNYESGELAVKGNLLAFNTKSKIRVYNLKEIRKGKYKLLKEYNGGSNTQGIALTGNGYDVIKVSQKGNKVVFTLYSNNAVTTREVDLSRYYGNKYIKTYGMPFEVEGVKVYNDKNTKYIYFGIADFTEYPRKSDILRIKYSDVF